MPPINQITGAIITAAMKVHSALGPGLLESAYEACLQYELTKEALLVERQVPWPVIYDGVSIDLGYRVDLLVEKQVIVELKCVDKIHRVHQAQILAYLRLSGKSVGLLINFHEAHLCDGIRRFVNGREWIKAA